MIKSYDKESKNLAITMLIVFLVWLVLFSITPRYLEIYYFGEDDRVFEYSGVKITEFSELSIHYFEEHQISKKIQRNLEILTSICSGLVIFTLTRFDRPLKKHKVFLGLIVACNALCAMVYYLIYMYPAIVLGSNLTLTMSHPIMATLFF